MAIKAVYLLLLAIGCVSAEVVKYDPCSSDTEVCNVSEVRIEPCSRAPKPCRLKKGTNVTISFDYTPDFDAEEAKQVVSWVNGEFEPTFTDIDSDACQYTECGLKAGKDNNFRYNLYLKKRLPKGKYPIRWKLMNKNNETQLCCFKTEIVLLS